MSIYWLTIFFLLVISNSDEFAIRNSSTEDRQWINNSTNKISLLNGGSHQSSKAAEIYFSKEIQKISANLSHQETINQRRNKSEEIFSEKNSYEQLIANLSKLAKVQSAGKDFPITGGVRVQNTKEPTLFGSVSPNLHINYNTSNPGIKQRNIRCYIIPKTAYMPEINEFSLAYACKLENKIFILTSKRFLQEHRNSILVNVDEETLDKINSPVTDTESGKLRIIPATFSLQVPGFNYFLHNRENVTSPKHTVNNKAQKSSII